MDAALRLMTRSPDEMKDIRFNPCFNGCRPATIMMIALPASASCFNPCFNGCRPATRKMTPLLTLIPKGFNPCFNGCRPATSTHPLGATKSICFNPCFNGCRPATAVNPNHSLNCACVSILVLMDAALRQVKFVLIHNCELGFNPCFNGCRPATYICLMERLVRGTFQSLF